MESQLGFLVGILTDNHTYISVIIFTGMDLEMWGFVIFVWFVSELVTKMLSPIISTS